VVIVPGSSLWQPDEKGGRPQTVIYHSRNTQKTGILDLVGETLKMHISGQGDAFKHPKQAPW
jgi:hypothetical protein